MSFRRGVLAGLSLLALTALIAAPAADAAKHKKKKLGSLTVVSATATSPGAVAPGPLSATATCPSGRALSGGFDISGPPGSDFGVITESSRVGDNAWRATFLPTDFNQTVTAEVYCANVKGAISTVSSSQQLGPSFLTTVSPTATCPQGQRVISGGFQDSPADPTASPGAFATENKLVGPNGWQATFLRGGGPSTQDQVTVNAYCRKPPKGKKTRSGKRKKVKTLPRILTEVATTTPTPSSEGASGTATTPPCSGKLRGVSGGFTTSLSNQDAGVIQAARFVNGAWNVRVVQVDSSPSGASFTAREYCG